MLLTWINTVDGFHRPQYGKFPPLFDRALRETLTSQRLLVALDTYSPPRRVYEAAVAYIFAMTITAPYADEDEAPEWVYEIEETGITDYLDTDSDESMLRFGRMFRAGAKGGAEGRHAQLLAGYFDFSKPHEAVVSNLIDEWVMNHGSLEVFDQHTRGLWRLFASSFQTHVAFPEIEGGTNPDAIQVRADAAELARIMRRAGHSKVKIAEQFGITRVTLDRWLEP